MDWIEIALVGVGYFCALYSLLIMLALLFGAIDWLDDRRDARRARRRRRRPP